jgi:predicted nucleic acid-binding protein
LNKCFADAVYFIALLNPADTKHSKARELSHSLQADVVTTTWVLVEVASAMSDPRTRTVFAEFVDYLKKHPKITIVPATQGSFDKGMELYRQRPDKKWSLVDCISFSTMENYGISEALTFDQHFVQAGFRALMR